MTWVDLLQTGWKGAVALVAAGVGGGVIALGIFKATGQQWLEHRFKKEIEGIRHEHNREIESTRAQLNASIDAEKGIISAFLEARKSDLLELSTLRLDAVNRRRDVYAELATKMRILLRGNTQAARTDELAFFAAYDQGHLWAAEPVAIAIRDLIETLEKKAAADQALKLTPPCFSAESGRPREAALSALSSGDAQRLRVSRFQSGLSRCLICLNCFGQQPWSPAPCQTRI
jgi:hypothetical protein